MNKKELIIGAIGIFLIISAFLGFPTSVQRFFMILSGVAISFLSFWKIISRNVAEIIDEAEKNEKVF